MSKLQKIKDPLQSKSRELYDLLQAYTPVHVIASRLQITEAEVIRGTRNILDESFGVQLSRTELVALQMMRLEGLLRSLKPGVDEGIPAVCRVWLDGLRLYKDLIALNTEDLQSDEAELYFTFEDENHEAAKVS